jgi:hypothetical protein
MSKEIEDILDKLMDEHFPAPNALFGISRIVKALHAAVDLSYAAGARDMRARAEKVCDDLVWNLNHAALTIRALPLVEEAE